MAVGQIKNIIVAVSGATGSIYAYRLLQRLHALDGVRTHLVISPAAALTISKELAQDVAQFNALADYTYSHKNIGASIASGSFTTDGMIVVPCSMRTLAAVAHGLSDNLITRAADVTLKERRKLILAVRETPFNLAHLQNMQLVTSMGGIIYPPMPAFYHLPQTIDDMVAHTVERWLAMLDLPNQALEWQG